MKNIIALIALLSFSTFSFSAEDGTGQGKSSDDNNLIAYCSAVIKAEDGTGQGKAEDGTGQGKISDPMIKYCKQLLMLD